MKNNFIKIFDFISQPLLCLLFIAISLFGSVKWAQFNAIFIVENVKIEGINYFDDTMLIEYKTSIKNQNIFFSNLKDYKNDIKSLDHIKDCKVSRVFPKTIKIEIYEREPLAMISSNDLIVFYMGSIQKIMAEHKSYLLNDGDTINIIDKNKPLLMDYIDPKKITYLPNTAGCFNSEEALRTLRLAREIGGWKLVKLEVLGDKKNLFPDMIETLKSTEVLTKEGFKVIAAARRVDLLADLAKDYQRPMIVQSQLPQVDFRGENHQTVHDKIKKAWNQKGKNLECMLLCKLRQQIDLHHRGMENSVRAH